MSLDKLGKAVMARKAERAGLQRGDDGPDIGKMLGTALLGPLGMQLVKSGGISPAMMAIDAISGKKKERRPGEAPEAGEGMKRGGKAKAKKYAKGGKASSASKRADGCATKGKTKGRFV